MPSWKSFFLGFITILLLNACKKINSVDNPAETAVNDAETVVASVRGIVVNENDLPVQGAAVKCGTATATTDMYGIFTFKGINISKNNGYVKVTKPGYFNGNRTFITTAGRTHNMRIKLLPKATTGTFVATTGGAVTLGTGGKVTFGPNIIVDAGGNAYTGVVNVAMTWINPTAGDLGSILQGDLRGITAAGYERVLETYGMLGVEITGASGQELKIATGKNAQLSIPIPSALQATAPVSIPLWHFDETKGRWVEEGSAAKVGNNYVGNVAHFSFWNCDAYYPNITLCVHVVNQNNQPLNNVTVRLRIVANPASTGYGVTDSLGNVCGAVPKNEALTLEILDRCGNVVYTQNIGPYSANAAVNIAAIIPLNTLTITGTLVNCNNAPVTNGNVLLYTQGGYYYSVPTNSNGVFTTTILNCNGTTINFTALPMDNTTSQQGNLVNGSGINGNVALGNLQACGSSSLEYINLLIDGLPQNWATPSDSISTYGGIGGIPYSFICNIFGLDNVNTTINNQIAFVFNYNNNIGPYPFYNIYITYYNGVVNSAQNIVSPANAQINLTALGTPISGFMEGNFNVNMLFQPGNIIRNVICNFKVRRP